MDAITIQILRNKVASLVDETFDLPAAAEAYRTRKAAEAQFDEFIRLIDSGHSDDAYSLGHRIVDGPRRDDSRLMLALADRIVSGDRNVPRPDLELARQAAKRAVNLTHGTDPGAFGVSARTEFLAGDTAKAVSLQTRAVDLAEDGMRQALEKELAAYRAADAPASRP